MKRNPWPYAIIAYFIVFISGVVTWVTFAIRNDDQLVRPDYYEHEIRYQKQIDRVHRTAPIKAEILAVYDYPARKVAITLPAQTNRDTAKGEIHFYRPSDSRLDRRFDLAIDSQFTQIFDVTEFKQGLWKVFVTWSDRGGDYYFEKILVLSEN